MQDDIIIDYKQKYFCSNLLRYKLLDGFICNLNFCSTKNSCRFKLMLWKSLGTQNTCQDTYVRYAFILLLVTIKMGDAHACMYAGMEPLPMFRPVLICYGYAHVHVHVQMEMWLNNG